MKYLLSLSLALFLLSCGRNSKEEEASSAFSTLLLLTDAQEKNAKLEIGELQAVSLSPTIRLTGMVEVPANSRISITTPINGYLTSIPLVAGMQISKGQLLAELESPELLQLEQDYLAALNKKTYLTKEMQRQEVLNGSKASSDKATEQARMELQSNEIQLAYLEQKLQIAGIDSKKLTPASISGKLVLRSPVNGMITNVDANRGKYASASGVIAELIDFSDLHLTLTVFEKDLPAIERGQKLIAYTNNDPGRKYTGTVSLITREINKDRNTEIHCHFDQLDKNVIPGAFYNVELKAAATVCRTLPEDAVVRFEGKEYVFIKTNDKRYQLTPVITGRKEAGLIVIDNPSDLEGKKIVVKNAYTLLMSLMNSPE